MSRELFIYWRVAPESLAEAVLAVRAWQAELRTQTPGLQARLYRRSDTADGEATVMETYALPGGGVGETLCAELAKQGDRVVARWCVGRRHVEVFEPLAPPAP